MITWKRPDSIIYDLICCWQQIMSFRCLSWFGCILCPVCLQAGLQKCYCVAVTFWFKRFASVLIYFSALPSFLRQETTCPESTPERLKRAQRIISENVSSHVWSYNPRHLLFYFPFINLHLRSTSQWDGAVVAQRGQRYTARCIQIVRLLPPLTYTLALRGLRRQPWELWRL